MLKIILQSDTYITPFNERARDLRIQNKPLWLVQRDVLAPYTSQEMELPPEANLPETREPCLVYSDNLFFDEFYIEAFLGAAKKAGKAVQASFSLNDLSFREHCLPLSTSYTHQDDCFLANLWYYPNGPAVDAEPLVIDMQAREYGYYNIPDYMAPRRGEIVYHVPLRSLIAIDSWVHIFIADAIFGLFGRGARFEERLKDDPLFKLSLLVKAMYEGRQVLESASLVKIGRNCTIDPTAIIHGPTTIGDNVTVNAGAVIENCIIGSNVNVSQGCQLMLSVIGDGTFLPFRASLWLTIVMENCIIAQNTCLQMCVIGRNTFIGAGNTFTDFSLLSTEIKARDGLGELNLSNRPVLGGCVGHNCRVGAGMVIYPARMIESDVVLLARGDRRVIEHDVSYEESDHHLLANAQLHKRLYPRPGEGSVDSW